MKIFAAVASLALAACAHDVTTSVVLAPDHGPAFAVATNPDGATVTLHEGRGPCLGESRLAVWASADRTRTVPGCWLLTHDGVIVSFLDGERGNIPAAALRKVSLL